jgi:hypothetical protein
MRFPIPFYGCKIRLGLVSVELIEAQKCFDLAFEEDLL